MYKLFVRSNPEGKVEKKYKSWLSSPIRRALRWFLVDVFYLAYVVNRSNHLYVTEVTGKGRLVQYLECVYLSLKIPSMPENYYKFEWFYPEKRSMSNRYLHRYQMKGVLYPLMYTPEELLVCPMITDKMVLEKWAGESGVPVAKTLQYVSCGNVTEEAKKNIESIKRDCFFKPVDSKGGGGCNLFRWDERNGVFVDSKTGESGALLELIDKELRVYNKFQNYLLQEKLVVHSELRPLSGSAAITIRLITILNEQGAPEIISAHIRFPLIFGAYVDNMHAGGISAPIDIESGVLSKATDYGLSGTGERYVRHPAFKSKIEGVRLPKWRNVCDLAVAGHIKAKPIKLVGWDICITDDGPVLVEANLQPCTDGPQRRLGMPLASSRFGELVEFHIRRSIDKEKWESKESVPKIKLLAVEN